MYTEQLVVRTRFKKKQENYTSYLWIFWDSTVRTRASAAIGKNSKDRYIDIYYIIFTFVDVSIVMQDVCILLTLIYVYYIYIYTIHNVTLQIPNQNQCQLQRWFSIHVFKKVVCFERLLKQNLVGSANTGQIFKTSYLQILELFVFIFQVLAFGFLSF